jgi:hypothetical protein
MDLRVADQRTAALRRNREFSNFALSFGLRGLRLCATKESVMNRKLNPGLSLAAGPPGGILSHCMRTTLKILLSLILGTIPGWAALGQPEASVSTDQLHMKSEDRVQTFQAYKVHQLTTANGPTVREYVSPQGLVFAITWQGRSTPDMNQLLGTYVNDLQTATAAQTRIQPRRGISVKTKDFVYSNFCRLRICTGSAYVPSLIPSNVSVEAIR